MHLPLYIQRTLEEVSRVSSPVGEYDNSEYVKRSPFLLHSEWFVELPKGKKTIGILFKPGLEDKCAQVIEIMVEYAEKIYVPLDYSRSKVVEMRSASEAGSWDGLGIDLVLTLGGDGTVLRAAWLFQNGPTPPIVSISLGSLGFLTTFPFEETALVLKRLLEEGGQVNLRSRLRARIIPAVRQPSSQNPCLPAYQQESVSYSVLNEVQF